MSLNINMLLKIINKYKSSEFVRNFLTLFSGSTISQFIPVLLSPVMSRLFTPEDFGRLAIFMAISTFVSGFMTGSYDTAIMLPKNKNNAINLLALSLMLSSVFCILVGISILFAGNFIAKGAGDITIAKYLYFAPIIVLSLGIYKTLNIWFTRYKKYKLLAGTRIAQTVTGSGIKLSTGVASLGVSGLIAGEIGRNIIGSIVLFHRFIKKEKQNIKLISKKSIILSFSNEHEKNTHLKKWCSVRDIPFFKKEQILVKNNRYNGAGHLNETNNEKLGHFLYEKMRGFLKK